MTNFLDVLAQSAKETLNTGYYDVDIEVQAPRISLRKEILRSTEAAVIAEVKVASPSAGVLKLDADVSEISMAMESGGAAGISVLTEPKRFRGSLASLVEVRKSVRVPVLMKDIIISPNQLKTACRLGANAVLLIQGLFDRGHCECDLHEMIRQAQALDLEVLLEAHTEEQFRCATETKADLVGVNNRDLDTFAVDLAVTERILRKVNHDKKVIVSESGIKTPADIRFLHETGANGFLVGSAIMTATDIKEKMKELVTAL